MIREAFEDYGRYKSDLGKFHFLISITIFQILAQNAQVVKILRNGKFSPFPSSDLQVGDICMIEEGDTFPADLFFLTSSAEEGNCFIKTSSLDGEKNLKKRVQIKDLDYYFPPEKLDSPKFQ